MFCEQAAGRGSAAPEEKNTRNTSRELSRETTQRKHPRIHHKVVISGSTGEIEPLRLALQAWLSAESGAAEAR